MQKLHIDESGSMTKFFAKQNGYFVFVILHTTNINHLKRVFKRFIASNMKELKKIDKKHKMFDSNGQFVELKGHCLPPSLKIKLCEYLIKTPTFKVYVSTINNNQLTDDRIYHNTARAFNYFLKLSLQRLLYHKHLPYDDYVLQIDERNTKTGAKSSLEDYLWTELVIEMNFMKNVTVEYFHSNKNIGIQIADFFSNLYFSYLHNPSRYQYLIDEMIQTDYMDECFKFPLVSQEHS